MRKAIIVALALALSGTVLHALTTISNEAEVEAVKAVIETAYIQGIHNERNVEKIRGGFHPDFNMLVLRDNSLSAVPIEQWISGIERSLERNPDPREVPLHAEYATVNVSGNAAIAQIEVFEGERQLYSDFMSLYKFADGWKIVNKIYYSHPR